MTTPHRKFAAQYLASLRAHLAPRRSTGSQSARALGRTAVAAGVTTLELARLHNQAVLALADSHSLADPRQRLAQRAATFFTHVLGALEVDRRATWESNRHLRQRNETLRRHTAALARANHRLQREVARRQAGEEKIKRSQARYRILLGESQAMQGKLRQLTRQIISAQEDERKQISRELHDEVVQTLVGINVALAALGAGAVVGAQTFHRQIARTQQLVQNSVSAVHRFARELRPAVLDDLGLIPALQAYSENLAARRKIRIRITTFRGVEDLSNERRTVLFRVAQEALNNVARHSGATQVALSIREHAGAVRMDISDDGKSFPVARTLLTKNNKRLGLIGMKERIEMIGGTFAIESAPGAGTTVRTEIPFQREAQHP